jgi:hypothetical protein
VVSDLTAVRAAGMALLILSAGAVALWLRRVGGSRWLAWGSAILIFLIPTTAAYAAWANISGYDRRWFKKGF